jgi:hypothetical protein
VVTTAVITGSGSSRAATSRSRTTSGKFGERSPGAASCRLRSTALDLAVLRSTNRCCLLYRHNHPQGACFIRHEQRGAGPISLARRRCVGRPPPPTVTSRDRGSAAARCRFPSAPLAAGRCH